MSRIDHAAKVSAIPPGSWFVEQVELAFVGGRLNRRARRRLCPAWLSTSDREAIPHPVAPDRAITNLCPTLTCTRHSSVAMFVATEVESNATNELA
jgi:hypothetical protein